MDLLGRSHHLTEVLLVSALVFCLLFLILGPSTSSLPFRTLTPATLVREERIYFHFQFSGCNLMSPLREFKCRDLEARTEAESTEEWSCLLLMILLTLLSCITQDHLPSSGHHVQWAVS